ncbi:hypothetical protein XU06_30345 (plasmid) [Rhodococcus erythropolis]|uniref:PaaX family transcriptional regulator n=1 Tax=Rhodococcus erythropolis TaxID=1833 RepID=UPI00061B5EC2|nr:PaaX family transcriptional regulator C-terminal domain-containing protein [Rhodococcus erythropolis]AKE01227.1 hypothetical protein XU06_30345 [Rhodococcus erythropolis]
MSGPQDPTSLLEPEIVRARRPKALALTLLGHLTRGEQITVSTGMFIEVLGRLGLSSHAARSTLSRLVDQGLLSKQKRGRETDYTLTFVGMRLLNEGNALVWEEGRSSDETWTVLAYSIPETRRALRIRLRSRLTWRGFGLLRSGVWVAPGRVDVTAMLDDLAVNEDVHVFYGVPSAASNPVDLIEEAYDLGDIAKRYTRFVERWSGEAESQFPDVLCALIVLRSEWQQLAQSDPHLPAKHLPPLWPATEAENLFRELYNRWDAPALEIGHRLAGLVEV